MGRTRRLFGGWRGVAVFAVSVLMIVPLKSGTAVGSHSLTDSLSSVGLLLSVNTAYLAFIVLLLFFVIRVSVNPERVATSHSHLPGRSPSSGRLGRTASLRFGLAGHVSPPGPDGLRDLLEPPLLGRMRDPAAAAVVMGES